LLVDINQHARLELGLPSDEALGGHLFAVESALKAVQTGGASDTLASIQHRLEGRVPKDERGRVRFNSTGCSRITSENVPNLRPLLFHHALGRLDGGRPCHRSLASNR